MVPGSSASPTAIISLIRMTTPTDRSASGKTCPIKNDRGLRSICPGGAIPMPAGENRDGLCSGRDCHCPPLVSVDFSISVGSLSN